MYWSCGYADNKEVELFALNGAIQLAEYFRNTAKQVRSIKNIDISDKIIVQRLNEKGYSLRQIAEIIGCSHTQVSNLLKN
jgi:DNA-directed RNA polymerase specialized sigma subunit